MRTGAPTGHQGYFHEAAFYSSDEEFLAIVVPFLRDGVAAGEPTLVGLTGPTEALLRAAVRHLPGIVFMDDIDGSRTRPASLIAANRKILAAYVADGAEQIRVLGEVPHPGHGAPWQWWARYEGISNYAYASFPAWGLCPYDTRITPEAVVDDVVHTHPHLATVDGHHLRNPRDQDPEDFLTRRPPRDDLLVPTSAPVVDLRDPTPRSARATVRAIAPDAQLPPQQIEDLVLAVNEAVSNAIAYGRPPVRVRLWIELQRIVATISDSGEGPTDPFAGMLPARSSASGGFGLWVIHQICSDVTLHHTEHGFTLRLVTTHPVIGRGGHA